MTRPRDWVARSPLMRKGGTHVKSKTGKRMRARLDLDDALCEWYEEDELDINEKGKANGEPSAPRSLYASLIVEGEIKFH